MKPDSLPHEVRILAVVAACVALGFGIVAPAIPVFAESFGVSNFAASSVISVFALMRFVSAFAGGRLVDRFGERIEGASGLRDWVAMSSATVNPMPATAPPPASDGRKRLRRRADVGAQGLGLPGLSLPWQERRVDVPDLYADLVAAPAPSQAPAPVVGPLQSAKTELPSAAETGMLTVLPPPPPPSYPPPPPPRRRFFLRRCLPNPSPGYPPPPPP